MKVPYSDALAVAMNQPAFENSMSTAEIERAIAQINEMLKKPMPNDERLMLVADRSELRATLKQRQNAAR